MEKVARCRGSDRCRGGVVIDWTKVRGAMAVIGAVTEGIITWTILSEGTVVVAGGVVVWTRLLVTLVYPGTGVVLGN